MSAGAETIWFGELYRGCRLDEVPGDYRAWAVYSDEAQRCDWVRRHTHTKCFRIIDLSRSTPDLPN